MKDAVLFWLVLQLVGLAALPAAALVFSRLPGGGLAFARPLSVLLAVYPAWILASLHLVGYGLATAVAGLALLGAGAIAWTGVRGRALLAAGRFRAALRTTRVRLWLAGEVLFAAGFFGCALMRSYSPDVWNTEKPMDVAFIGAINRSEEFPPHDPWFSGHSLNYYYFGHYVVAFFARVTGIDAVVAFNLGIALYFALSVTAAFALVSALYLAATRAGAPSRSPILVGMAAVALTMLLGNLAGGFEYLRNPDRLLGYDWWSPSRVIPGTANEFPAFSFLLGDLHAHVMAVPFVLVALALGLRLALSGPSLPEAGRWLRPGAELLLAALAVGALYPVNSLDFPIAATLVGAALALWATRRESARHWKPIAAWGVLWVTASVLLYLPFWVSFSPAVHGLGIVSEHQQFTRFARDELLIYGLLLWAVATAFLQRARRVPFRYLVWGFVAVTFVLVLLAPSRLAGLALLSSLAAFALYTAFDPQHPQPYRFVWLLIAAGLGAITVAELVYLRDFFLGTPDYRFNTVFKLGFHAWFLLALAGACLAFWSRAWMGRRSRLIWQAGLVALLALALAYPVAGSYARSQGFANAPTLAGDRWLAEKEPGTVAAIAWLRSRPGTPTVLEAVGSDFDFDGRGRISSYTGLPTVIGWPGHEVQWGRDPGTRAEDVRTIYSTTSIRKARSLLARYRVRYVVVGGLERADYPRAGLAKFARLGRPAFRAAGTVVYETEPYE